MLHPILQQMFKMAYDRPDAAAVVWYVSKIIQSDLLLSFCCKFFY